MLTNQFSITWLCCAAEPRSSPCGIRTTRLARACPPNMYRAFATWFTSSSIAGMTKSAMRISMTGRVPTSAAPSPAPMIVASAIGVLTTRAGPNSASSPWYWPNTPPISTSSPRPRL